MDDMETQMHLRAGLAAGEQRTCGQKINYHSEEAAGRAAAAMNAKGARNQLEPYPCVFCEGWHIGRMMTADERARYSEREVGQ